TRNDSIYAATERHFSWLLFNDLLTQFKKQRQQLPISIFLTQETTPLVEVPAAESSEAQDETPSDEVVPQEPL
ncbi:hypothetical protein BgiBS90_008572, partial [Biomphalaria glabrata]